MKKIMIFSAIFAVAISLSACSNNETDISYASAETITLSSTTLNFEKEGGTQTAEVESTTTTTAAETEATKKTTTTKFKKDALFPLGDDVKYPDSIPFLVKSDTSYLNLRYGPSKKYDVIEKIPDGKTINGYGERTDGDGDIWVYVKYNDKSGWVMKELLSGTE